MTASFFLVAKALRLPLLRSGGAWYVQCDAPSFVAHFSPLLPD